MKKAVNPQVERMGIVDVRRIKYSSRKHYVTLTPDVVETYNLRTGDLLKIAFIEVRRGENNESNKEET